MEYGEVLRSGTPEASYDLIGMRDWIFCQTAFICLDSTVIDLIVEKFEYLPLS